ncbi:MAG TPA: phage infection protein [bacterium]|nr:phage infection protein [bacterium]
MKRLKAKMVYCNGINKLEQEFDFTEKRAVAIYAPNGVMKSSFAQTFTDLTLGIDSQDRVFKTIRQSIREITDENGVAISKEEVFVIKPYDQFFSHTEKTSTLLINKELKKEYEKYLSATESAKETFISALKKISKTRRDIENEISITFSKESGKFFESLIQTQKDVTELEEAVFSNLHYDQIFDEAIIKFLSEDEIKNNIEDYSNKHEELLEKSTYFKKNFNYYNAETISKNLASNNFFKANHTIVLNADNPKIIRDETELRKLIEEEQKAILNDPDLKRKYDRFSKKINVNKDLRDFGNFISENRQVLPHLKDLVKFREDIWKSYFKTTFSLFVTAIETHEAVLKKKLEIEKKALEDRTQWQSVVDIFNRRFHVPFNIEAANKIQVALEKESLLKLTFTFKDGQKEIPIDQNLLLEILSQGEKKALYILNIIFEIEVRKLTGRPTLFIIDDIADSFDYKNKYAIIEYLKELLDHDNFYQIILTHNFDFFRTVAGRYVGFKNCYFAFRSDEEIYLKKAVSLNNIFVDVWKREFFTDQRKRIASIPFIRNIIQYTDGDSDANYLKLTSLLHRKNDSDEIKQSDLDDIFNQVFKQQGISSNGDRKVIDVIHSEAAKCLGADDGVNFENKIVLSIAIRLMAEDYMKIKINDQEFLSRIKNSKGQTFKLFKEFKNRFEGYPAALPAIDVLDRVMLMTPEIIHLNSFMYEPILDMSDKSLKRLYVDVRGLK